MPAERLRRPRQFSMAIRGFVPSPDTTLVLQSLGEPDLTGSAVGGSGLERQQWWCSRFGLPGVCVAESKILVLVLLDCQTSI